MRPAPAHAAATHTIESLRFAACRLFGSALTVLAAVALARPTHAQSIDLQGHRGARALAPENTMAGFRRALAIGVTTLEADLAISRDGVLVLSHDTRLNPALTRDAKGRWLTEVGPSIGSLTLSELQSYDVGRLQPGHAYSANWPRQQPADGERIPALRQLLDLVGPLTVRLNLETKLTPSDNAPDPHVFAQALVTVLRGAHMTARATVQSFDWRTLFAVKAIAPEIETSCLTIESPQMDTIRADGSGASPWHAGLRIEEHGGSLPSLVRAAGCSIWSPFWRNLTQAQLSEAHALGLRVIPWTVNDALAIEQLLTWGIDGLISDDPENARTILERSGRRVR